MASRPHIGLAFKRLHEARALNAYLLVELAGREPTAAGGLTCVLHLKEGGRDRSNGAAGHAERVPSQRDLTRPAEYAILVKRARRDFKREYHPGRK